MSDFYAPNDYRSYLMHHGIKGMRWGEQNGPPYPLSTKVHNMVVKSREKRKAKRRENILHDPRKLYKHRKEFTKEEIDAAIEKIDSGERVKSRIKPNFIEKKVSEKVKEKEQHDSDIQLAKKLDKYAPSAAVLEKNVSKLTQRELNEAVNRVGNRQRIFDQKMNELDRPRRFLQIGSDLLATINNAVGNVKKTASLFEEKYDPDTGLTKEETRLIKIYKQAKGNQEALENLSIGVDKFGDRYRKIINKKMPEVKSYFKESLENGNIDVDDLPEDIYDWLKDDKDFDKYFD